MKFVGAINFHSSFEHLYKVAKVVLSQNIKILKMSRLLYPFSYQTFWKGKNKFTST